VGGPRARRCCCWPEINCDFITKQNKFGQIWSHYFGKINPEKSKLALICVEIIRSHLVTLLLWVKMFAKYGLPAN
jgi:hypothetical protein